MLLTQLQEDLNIDLLRLLVFGVSGLTVYFLYRVFIYPFYVSPFRDLPEPPGGNKFPWAHANQIRKEHDGQSFRTWISQVPNQGMIRFRVLFNKEHILLTSPQALKEILVTRPYDFIKPATPNWLFRQVLGNGLLVAEGADHKPQRKGLASSFAYRHIKDLYPLFLEKAQQSADQIAKSKSPQNAFDWARLVTLDIIGEAAMGYSFNSLENPNHPVVQQYRLIFENEPPNFRWTFLGIHVPVRALFSLPLPMFITLNRAAKAIRDTAHRAISENQSKDRKDILSLARESGKFSEDDLVNQLMTFLAAGHETTASALTWCVYLLCKHQDIQSRLRKELQSLDSRAITPSDIDNLPYLHAVCSEVLRVIPSVPATVRDAVVDTTLLGRPIARGTRLFISPWATNVDSDLWGPNAETFDPERWLAPGQTNAGGSTSNYANLTFLHGPRSCIGKDFAKAEFACLVAVWFRRFAIRFESKELEPDFEGWVTIHPGHRLPVVFDVQDD